MLEVNKEYIVRSLLNQITVLTLQVAERDAVITDQKVELKSLRAELYGDESGQKEETI